MKEIVATLIYDSWTQPAPERRAIATRDRHLIFEGNGLILDLLLKQQEAGTCIHVGGQVLPGNRTLNAVSDVAVMMKQGAHRTTTRTNALGEFAFHAIPNGTMDLTIILEDLRFAVHGLSNEEPRNWEVVASSMGKA